MPYYVPCPACAGPLVPTGTGIEVCCNTSCDLAGDLYLPVRAHTRLGRWLVLNAKTLGIGMRPSKKETR